MKKLVIVLLILTQVTTAFSQTNKRDIAFELRCPIPTGNNFLNEAFGKGYIGITDIGVDYSVFKKGNWSFGILNNTSLLTLPPSEVTLLIVSPKIKIDYSISFGKVSFTPNIALGYSSWRFKSHNDIDSYKENQDGFTCKAGSKLVLNCNNHINLYLQIAYEYTKLELLDNSQDYKYNRNIEVLYPGFGVIWKL